MENPLFDTLHERGYEIVGISSGFAEVSLREADRYITTGSLNEVEIGLLRRTIFGDVLNTVAPDFASQQARDRITTNFATLGDARGRAARPSSVRLRPLPEPPSAVGVQRGRLARTVPTVANVYADDPAPDGPDGGPAEGRLRGRGPVPPARPLLEAIDAIDRRVGGAAGDRRLRRPRLLGGRRPRRRAAAVPAVARRARPGQGRSRSRTTRPSSTSFRIS